MDDDTKVNGYDCGFSLIAKQNDKVKVQVDEEGNEIQPSWEEMGASNEETLFLTILSELYKKSAKKLYEVKAKCGLGKVKKILNLC